MSAGSLPALNLLFDPYTVRFGTLNYQVLLQHWAQLGWVKQWRRGKAVVFGVDWPRPIYDPGCQPSYEGLIPNSRSVRAASVAANVANLAAQSAPMASASANVADPAAPSSPMASARAAIEPPTAASHFRDAMGAVQAAGTSGTFEVWCSLASLNF